MPQEHVKDPKLPFSSEYAFIHLKKRANMQIRIKKKTFRYHLTGSRNIHYSRTQQRQRNCLHTIVMMQCRCVTVRESGAKPMQTWRFELKHSCGVLNK